MPARDRFAGAFLLPRREFVAVNPVDEKMDAFLAMTLREAAMVRRAFIAKMNAARQQGMMREIFFAGENVFQNARGRVAFDGAMEIRREIGRGEVNLAVLRIGRGRDGSGVRRPH